ncbi:MAG TPA: HEPN domain-containing protein [Prolixibacteraceae bacterium]|nr:HEPN domain-containing protein [Prolixibacteraceae bacterium]
MKKTTKDWLNSAESDLQLIQEIISLENLTHLSAFHAQQAIEKSFKAIIEEFDLGFIKSHSLEMLYNKVNDKISTRINSDLLILLDQLYIDARYPGELGLLPDGKPSILEAESFFDLGKQLFKSANKIQSNPIHCFSEK